MMKAMREHADGAPAHVSTFTQLQAAEDELDTLLLRTLAGPHRAATGP